MSALLSYFLQKMDENDKRQKFSDWASNRFGADSDIASVAQGDLELARKMALAQLDPEFQMKQKALSAVQALAGGAGQQGTITPISDGNLGDFQPNAPIPQTLPSQNGAPTQAPALSQIQEQLFAAANPSEYLKWKVDQPKRQMDMAKEQSELQDKQIKRANELNAVHQGYKDAMDSFDRLIGPEGTDMGGTLKEAYDQANPMTTGRMGFLGRLTLGPESTALDKNLTVLRANQLIGTLKSLKESSPSGASGFGSLSNKEGEKLESLVASLDPNQGEEQLKKNLQKLNTEMNKSRERLKEGYQRELQAYGQKPEGALSQVSQGKVYVNPQTGQRITKVNGQWLSLQ